MKGFDILKSALAVVSLSALSLGAFAQTGVSINSTGTAPDAQAILDIDSRNKGVLLPRLTTGDITTLEASLDANDDGMIIYDVSAKVFKYWDGSILDWQTLINNIGPNNTLDQAYDQGGAGAGRIIVADAGNVEIQGAGYLTVGSNVGIGTTAPDRRMKISGTGWTAMEVENTDNQAAALELTSQGVSSYVYTDATGFLGLESAAGEDVVIRTDAGAERMRIQNGSGDVRVTNLADASSAVVLSDPQGDLTKTSLTGSATDVFLGNGSFGPASAFGDDDWFQTLSTNRPSGINDWIYTNGRVGIGVGAAANPSAPLEVAATGAGNPSSNAIMASNPTNSAGNDAIITARVAGSSAGDPFFSMDISGEAGWSMGIDNSEDNKLKIAPSWSNLSSSTAMTIQTNGNVGIGTTTPLQKLQTNGVIRSNGSYMIDVDGANGAGPRIALGSTANVYEFMNLGAYNGINNLETTTRDFRIGSDNAVNAIYVKAVDGNVGIGTATPDANLNVGNANGATIYLTREDPTTTTNEVMGSILFDNTDNTVVSSVDAAAGIRGYASQNQGNSNKGGYMTFFTKDNVAYNAAATERMRIHADGTVRIASLDQNANRIVMADANGDLYASASLIGSGLGDNLGNHTATQNLAMQGLEIDNVRYVDVTAGTGHGLRFWQDNQYAINMGNAAEFQYGPVNDYSIKMNMSNNAGRGWTWGVDGATPVAALEITGVLQIANTFRIDGLDVIDNGGGWHRSHGATGFYFQDYGTGIRAVAPEGGNYGSVSTYSGIGGWEGYSIGGRMVFMHDMNTNVGIYNDVDNEWMFYASRNGASRMYYNGSDKLQTTNTGVHVSGKILTDGINETSDVRFKTAISTIDGALGSVLKMNGVTYDWRRDEFPDKNFTDVKQYGLIAQELEKIIPELVNTDEEGWKSIEYTHLVPVLIEALKEQQQIIESQKQDINNLELKADANATQIEAILQQINGYTNK